MRRADQLAKGRETMTDILHKLAGAERAGWDAIHARPFWQHLRAYGLDRDLYVALMTQVYHYTSHNAQNQALAAVSIGPNRTRLLKYCLHHAYEEAGHEKMVLADLNSLGVDAGALAQSRPIPETEAFVAYLYRIAREDDATARLGYSYWAEGAYAFIGELLSAMRRDLNLSDRQMTFFVEHSTIDSAHLEAVRKMLIEFCDTPSKQSSACSVLECTLHLTGRIIDGVFDRYSHTKIRPQLHAEQALS
jgi:pyrroloquinoline quinone (PQQ) biosynthesis protein C